MGQRNKTLASIFSAIVDFLINLCSIYIAYLVMNNDRISNRETVIAALVVSLVTVLIYFMFDIYSTRVIVKLQTIIMKMVWAQLVALVLVAVVVISLKLDRSYYLLVLICAGISLGALALKKIVTTKLIHQTRILKFRVKPVVIVGNGESAEEYARALLENQHFGYHIIGCVTNDESSSFDILGTFEELDRVLDEHSPHEVIIALDSENDNIIQHIIEICDTHGIRASIVPLTYKYFKSKCQVDMLGNLPIINTRRIPLDNPANAVMKRLMDIVTSLILIVLTSPIMIFAAIGVRLSSKGPIIFKQKRVGRDNELFTMFKFRSMRVNDMENTGWTTNDDPRKTRFGTFLRKTGIDELPQLFNVLFGTMSIIGPRPELPTFVEQYSKTIPLYKVKHQVKPGITGLAQIYGYRGDTSIERRIELDIKYIEEWSLFNDIKILFITPFKMFNRNEKYIR